jgi:Lrp/AsnC family transcriptional regulator, regulator for asnA, asnC and gidA
VIGRDGGDGLDAVDKAIVRELQRDGRMPFAQLADHIGLSQAATRQRYHRLVARGVLQVVAVADPAAIGFGYQAMLGVVVEDDAVAVAERFAAHTEAEYVVLTAGRFDLLVEVVCRDADELVTLVNESLRAIEGVARIEQLTFLRVVKQTYAWGTA